ncbi:MAG TPA: chorismate mutase [Draconibacterium sp.]|nr:chorismate mutase [Draconibacterium sp.]
MKLKRPDECNSPEEIRNEIDKIDQEIISLFSKRHSYIEEIVRFKNDENEIIASDRKEQVIRQRREWAASQGLNAHIFEQIYTLLIDSNIRHEMNLLTRKKS